MRLERLSLEQGNVDGPQTQSEHGEESERKRPTTKVNYGSCPCGQRLDVGILRTRQDANTEELDVSL